jgi:hypothetical protein
VAADDGASTAFGTPVTITPLANDSDPDGDPLAITAVTQGANGRVVLNADGTLGYTPDAGFSGLDRFSYTVADPFGGSASASVTVAVQASPDAPVAAADAAETIWGTPVTLDVLENDSATLGGELAVIATSQGGHGAVVLNADGTVSYTPEPGFVGTDVFGYTIREGDGLTASGLVEVTILRGELVWTNESGDGDWNNPQNWDQGVVPTPEDVVIIPDAAGAPVFEGDTTLTSLKLFDELLVNNGTLTLTGASSIEETGNLILDGVVLDGTATLVNVGTLTLRDGAVRLALDNQGTIVADGGTLDAGDGTLVNDGLIIIPAGKTLDVEAATFLNRGEIQGHGVLNVRVPVFVNEGNLSPGSSPGIFSIDGDYTQSAAGVLTIELGGAAPGVSHDQLVVSGTATLAGELRFVLLNGYVPSAADNLVILRAASIVGDFSSVSGLPPGMSFSIRGGFQSAVSPTVLVSPPLSGGGALPAVDATILMPPPEPNFLESDFNDWLYGEESWRVDIDSLMDLLAGDLLGSMEGGEQLAEADTGEGSTETANDAVDYDAPTLEASLRKAAEGFSAEQRAILEVLMQAQNLLRCG